MNKRYTIFKSNPLYKKEEKRLAIFFYREIASWVKSKKYVKDIKNNSCGTYYYEYWNDKDEMPKCSAESVRYAGELAVWLYKMKNPNWNKGLYKGISVSGLDFHSWWWSYRIFLTLKIRPSSEDLQKKIQ